MYMYVYMYILVQAYRRISSELLFGDAQHFPLSDNTGPKRLLQSPAPLALFPPLPRKTLQHISTQLLTTF